jgi:OPA family glycerol-3-phosphate transporter-like MFS transporter
MRWNTCKNLFGGGASIIVFIGLMIFKDNWRLGGFFFPSLLTLCICVFCFFFLKDNPKTAGFEPIHKVSHTKDSGKFFENMIKIFKSKLIWFAFANAFLFATRFGILNWCMLFLKTDKQVHPGVSAIAYAFFEIGGLMGIIFSKKIIARFFKQDEKASCFYLSIISALIIILYTAFDHSIFFLSSILFVFAVGFTIYIPLALIQLRTITLVSKKKVASATGFSEMFGYVIGYTIATSGVGIIANTFSLTVAMVLLSIPAILAGFIVLKVWNEKIEF